MAFAAVYPLSVAKAERTGRTREEVHEIVHWLTGDEETMRQEQIDKRVDFATFLAPAPRIGPNVSRIRGVIRGYRVEEIEDPLMRQVRYLNKLVDEPAKGGAREKIPRQ